MGPFQESQSASSNPILTSFVSFEQSRGKESSTNMENIKGNNNLGFEMTDRLSKSSKKGIYYIYKE